VAQAAPARGAAPVVHLAPHQIVHPAAIKPGSAEAFGLMMQSELSCPDLMTGYWFLFTQYIRATFAGVP
jgi:hypothetical protein